MVQRDSLELIVVDVLDAGRRVFAKECACGVSRESLRLVDVQMFPTVHGENCVSLEPVVGFMMYWPLALQFVLESGQHVDDSVQLLPHCIGQHVKNVTLTS